MEEPQSFKIQDEDRLAQLGYKQELQRDWSVLHNFGVSFSIIVSREQSTLCTCEGLAPSSVTKSIRRCKASPSLVHFYFPIAIGILSSCSATRSSPQS